jgi:CheY-like chemotaxis protein
MLDLNAVVSSTENMINLLIGKNIELLAALPAGIGIISGDPGQIEQVIMNLAVNARDAMPSGGKLSVSAAQATRAPHAAEPTLQAGDYIRIVVVDNGAGMDELTLAKATEPFFTTKGPGKGTGLGLSMVHGLAAQSGGLLRINSEPNVGTTLELWLPVADAAAAVNDERSLQRTPTIEACKVLLVDDDMLVMTGTAAMIEDLGHTAIEAHSGAEALAKLASGIEVDVVITDHAMPSMTGLQLAQRIQEKYSGLPIILATGYAELPGDSNSLGILRLAKPCNQYDIAMAIQSALGSREAARKHA